MTEVFVDATDVRRGLDVVERWPTHQYMEGVASVAKFGQVDRFNSKTDPDGGHWAPWSRSYRKRAPKHAGHTLLRDTGDLRGSFRTAAMGNNRASVFSVGEVFDYHQRGTKRMPARPMLGIGREDVRRAGEHLFSYFDEELNA